MTENLPPEISNDETFKGLIDKVKEYINTHGSDTSSSRPPLQLDHLEESSSSSSNVAKKKYHKIDENENVDGDQETSQNYKNAGVGQQENNEASTSNNTTESESEKNVESSSRRPKNQRSESVKEVIEQFEPGVYVTVLLLSDGTKVFKRIRFRYFNIFLTFQYLY